MAMTEVVDLSVMKLNVPEGYDGYPHEAEDFRELFASLRDDAGLNPLEAAETTGYAAMANAYSDRRLHARSSDEDSEVERIKEWAEKIFFGANADLYAAFSDGMSIAGKEVRKLDLDKLLETLPEEERTARNLGRTVATGGFTLDQAGVWAAGCCGKMGSCNYGIVPVDSVEPNRDGSTDGITDFVNGYFDARDEQAANEGVGNE